MVKYRKWAAKPENTGYGNYIVNRTKLHFFTQ
jgi:hypothetical protein